MMTDGQSEFQPETLPKTAWQITATSVYCDCVRHQATIMIYKDWQTDCSYYKRWGPVTYIRKSKLLRYLSKLVSGSPMKKIKANCSGPATCELILRYRDKLIAEELETQHIH